MICHCGKAGHFWVPNPGDVYFRCGNGHDTAVISTYMGGSTHGTPEEIEEARAHGVKFAAEYAEILEGYKRRGGP